MKKFLFLITIIFTISIPCFATDTTVEKHTEKKQNVAYTNFRDCIKLYKLPYDKLYFLALSSIEANKYEIIEMQSRGGYIIFEADKKEFLISILQKDKYYTYMKIAPCDNNYYFSSKIPENIFNQIALLFNSEIKEIKL